MRRLRFPSRSRWFLRSAGVIDVRMASRCFMRLSVATVSICCLNWPRPGIMPMIFCMLPSFCICRIWPSMSSRVNWFFTRRWAMRWASPSSIFSLACSMRVRTSPMPRILWAMRSGWKRSKSSSFSPLPANLMGCPVMCLMLKAAPPLVSPSVLVRITPVMPSFSWKAPAERTASWPVMASATKRISAGAVAALMRASSCMSTSSRCRRPAVSRITTSQPLWRASSTAERQIVTGSRESVR